MSGYSDQNLVEASMPVKANNMEITRQATILLRLIKLLDSPDGHQDTYDELAGRVASMSSLRDQFESECVEDIRALARDDYRRIRELGLGSELIEMIIKNINKISENIG